ncbi:FtsW/RodA/SpoVE family cell cycle protein [Bifidobacterium sp. 82T24]|uniref:FtsW/RodA/SpoVE family cell cycle protein n=1 Tax=Bifidobacterium pluvialisilvae TaxID=2834436 RepID=UPI001C5659FF|nr:FtsW/RodA/SpoVE family cell cycle protein [Bifidobacterium pluvialisilvae]MBW3088719.1 FtsW/RodA/SpoVE family cell cycle protein [Bifidobacterium pluvialisilvae]
MIVRRLRQASLLVLAAIIVVLGFFQMFMRVQGSFPPAYTTRLGVVGVLFLVFWIVLVRFQPYTSPVILPCVLLLSGTGVLMIARIDSQNDTFGGRATTAGLNQLTWLALALVLCILLVIFLKDYRVLRRFSYVSMVTGLALLLSPMIPGLGKEIQGARIWIGFGSHSLQPGEFAKLFLAFFFAAYLFDHRDQLAVGGRKVLGLRLPRLKDLGPIIVVWAVCMGVLVLQHDLGTSLMFFAMFVSMLYVATGQKSWIVIGGVFFAGGAVLASMIFTHVGNRVNAWLHPFDYAVYNAIGGSMQLVQGVFGLATGGMTGTGLGQGHPIVTPLANSDFIYSSLGEELGMTGLFAILTMYLIIIGAGMVTAMKVSDGFGKLLASGLVFTMAFQVFTVVGGITLVIPLTGLTLPYLAAGGSSLIANCILATLLLIIANAANKPEEDVDSDTFQYEALMAIREKEKEKQAEAAARAEQGAQAGVPQDMPYAQQALKEAEAANQEATEVITPGRHTPGGRHGAHAIRQRRQQDEWAAQDGDTLSNNPTADWPVTSRTQPRTTSSSTANERRTR